MWTWTKSKDWCFGLAILSEQTSDKSFTISLIILVFIITLEFSKK